MCYRFAPLTPITFLNYVSQKTTFNTTTYNGAHGTRIVCEIFIFLRVYCGNKQKRSTTISFHTVYVNFQCRFFIRIDTFQRFLYETNDANGKSKSNGEHARSRQREFLRLYLIKRASSKLLRENEKFEEWTAETKRERSEARWEATSVVGKFWATRTWHASRVI